MRGGDQLMMIGIYIVLDGVISIYSFWNGYFDNWAQFFRLVRTIIGIYLVWMGGVYDWNYQK